VPLILGACSDTNATEDERAALTYLRMWDRAVTADAPAASIFEAFYVRLVSETLVDEMGPELLGVYDTLASMPLTTLQRLLHQPSSPWFDDSRTTDREDRDEIIRRSFNRAIQDLRGTLGPDVKNWRWTVCTWSRSAISSRECASEADIRQRPVSSPGLPFDGERGLVCPDTALPDDRRIFHAPGV